MNKSSIFDTLQTFIERLAEEVAEKAATRAAEKVATQVGCIPSSVQVSHDDFVYCDEARKLLGGVSYMTLSRWDKTGYLPKHHVGRRVVYRRVDIINLLKKGSEK